MTQKSSYIETQLSRLENQNGDGLKPSVQLYGAVSGKTHQLSVSPTQLDAISAVLMMDDSGDEASASAQESVGNAIAQTLGLKKGVDGRYMTDVGCKTARGIGATVLQTLADAIKSDA